MTFAEAGSIRERDERTESPDQSSRKQLHKEVLTRNLRKY